MMTDFIVDASEAREPKLSGPELIIPDAIIIVIGRGMIAGRGRQTAQDTRN